MATDTLLTNWDGYRTARNNYYVYCEDPKPCTMLPSGIDNTFGSFDSGKALGREIHAFDGVGLLFEKCLSSPRCHDQYVQALGNAVSVFRSAGLETVLDQARALIADAAQRAVRPRSAIRSRYRSPLRRRRLGQWPLQGRVRSAERRGWPVDDAEHR